jgi:polar amino acid transport system substrate-binding protein
MRNCDGSDALQSASNSCGSMTGSIAEKAKAAFSAVLASRPGPCRLGPGGISPAPDQRPWAPAAVKVKTVADLKGLRVGVPRGAMQDLVLTPLAEANGLNIMRFDDKATKLQALIAGQIDIGGTGLLVNRRLNRNDPGKDYEVKIVLRPLHFGIGVRRGQTDLLQWLNTFVYAIKNNGELDAISRKWRELPLEDLPVF